MLFFKVEFVFFFSFLNIFFFYFFEFNSLTYFCCIPRFWFICGSFFIVDWSIWEMPFKCYVRFSEWEIIRVFFSHLWDIVPYENFRSISAIYILPIHDIPTFSRFFINLPSYNKCSSSFETFFFFFVWFIFFIWFTTL